MTNQSKAKLAPISNTDSNPKEESSQNLKDRRHFKAFWKRIRQQNDALLIIRQLNQMIKSVQLHRGMSMSLLAGGKYFQTEIVELQEQLQRQIIALEVFTDPIDELLSDKDRSCLDNAWRTIAHDWHDDDVIDNFELHSHFVDELLTMVVSLSKRLTYFSNDQSTPIDSADNDESVTYPQTFKQIELLNFVAKQLPQTIEQVAKIRGLSSHAATIGKVEHWQGRYLRYLIQCVKTENQKLRYQADRISTLVDIEFHSIGNIKAYENKLLFLFGCLENDLLGEGEKDIDGQQLFKLSSEIINTYSRIVDDGWGLVRRWLDNDIQYRVQQ
ncbi:hypothetical protein NBRC116493_28980 [Aurantivibrio infirmus]